MAGRLTQRAIDSAKTPKTGQVFIRDGEIRGFALRITSSGSRAFVWDGRIRGRMVRITIGRYPALSLDEARAKAFGIRHEIAIGLDPKRALSEERRQPTVHALGHLYIENYARPRKKSWREVPEASQVAGSKLSGKPRRRGFLYRLTLQGSAGSFLRTSGAFLTLMSHTRSRPRFHKCSYKIANNY
jgi:hypothetical protein